MIVGADPETERDTAAILTQFVAQTGVTFDLGWTLDATYQQFRASGGDGISPYPLEVLVDREGVVRYINREFDSTALDAAIQQVLAE